MKKKSFLLSFFLAMLFVVLGSVNVKADETLEGYTYVNPMYEDLEGNFEFESDFELYSESDSEESDEEDGLDTYDSRSVQYTSDKQSLIKTFRQQLVNRAETIALYYHCNQKITQDFFDEFSAELFNGAVAHTGVGKEGDYIRWHYQGWRVNANYKTDRNGGYNLNITYNMYYLSDASQESQMDQAVSNVLKSLNLSNKTDYQKIKAIYDYICSNITYDYVNLNDDSYLLKHTAYAALINKTAVCQGYATLFYRLSLESGVDTRVITGDSGGPHAWNIVKLNGKYYNLDSTWDAGSSSYYYFLKSMNDFSNHTRYEEYQTSDFTSAYPMAEKSYSESGNQEPLEKEHNYGQPMYVWANDHKSITAARICQNDSSHIEQETAEAEQTVIKEPTCTEKGSVLWRAVFENPAFEAQEEVVEEKENDPVVVEESSVPTAEEIENQKTLDFIKAEVDPGAIMKDVEDFMDIVNDDNSFKFDSAVLTVSKTVTCALIAYSYLLDKDTEFFKWANDICKKGRTFSLNDRINYICLKREFDSYIDDLDGKNVA